MRVGRSRRKWQTVAAPSSHLFKQFGGDIAGYNVTAINRNGGCRAARIDAVRRIDCQFDARYMPSKALRGNEDSIIDAGQILAERNRFLKQLPLGEFVADI